jgi:hypothetical protein
VSTSAQPADEYASISNSLNTLAPATPNVPDPPSMKHLRYLFLALLLPL